MQKMNYAGLSLALIQKDNEMTLSGLSLRAFRIRTQMRAVKLERVGMKHSGGNLTPKLKEFYQLPKRASYDALLKKMQEELDIVNESIRGETSNV